MAGLRRVAAAAACLGAVVATAACGSTVAVRTTLTQGTGDGLAPSQSGARAPSLSAPPTENGQPGATTTVTGGAVVSPSGRAGTTGADVSGAVGPLVGGDAKPVLVGVITSGNVGGFGSSLGLDLNYGDQRAQAQLIASYINSHGGVHGHPIKLTYYDFDVSSGNAGNAEAACAAFTQDQHVFASIGVAGMDDAYHACAAKHGMLVLSDGDLKSTTFFRRFPTTIEVSDLDLVRKYRAMVPALDDMGFFTAGAKIGLLYEDGSSDLEGIRLGMKPALASLGLKVTDEVAISSTDSSQNASQTASAVLKFRAEGVTHILFGTAAAWLFAQAAEQQRYFPKMGVESRQSPGLLMQTADSPDQLVNVMGVGYQPVQDVDGAHDPGPVSSNQKLCLKLLHDGGQGTSTRLALASALYLCDELFFLHDAFAGAPDLSRQSFLAGVAGLGPGYGSSLTFATRFSASQHDGAQGYRQVRYQTGCSCFVYSGPLRLLR